MNRDYVLWNLREAREELDELITRLEAAAAGAEEFRIAVAHTYHHLNTAWNARESSEVEARECSAENFREWRQFPTDIDLTAE